MLTPTTSTSIYDLEADTSYVVTYTGDDRDGLIDNGETILVSTSIDYGRPHVATATVIRNGLTRSFPMLPTVDDANRAVFPIADFLCTIKQPLR